MQKIRSEEKFFSAPSFTQPLGQPTADPPPCTTCGSTVLWESTCRDGVFRCEQCEPAPSKRMIGRRIDVAPVDGSNHSTSPTSKTGLRSPGQNSGGEADGQASAAGYGLTDGAMDEALSILAATDVVVGPDEDLRQLASTLVRNRAAGNVTGNDWADARRRYRLTDLVEIPNGKTGDLAATGYPRYVNQRF